MQIKTKVPEYMRSGMKAHQMPEKLSRPDLSLLSLPKKKKKKSFTTIKEGGDLNLRSSLPRMLFM